MRSRLTPIGILFAVIGLATICGSALAYFSTNGTGTASAAVGTLTTPTISAATAEAGGRVKLTWSAATVPGGTVSYFVKRDGGAVGGNCPTEAAPATAITTCTDTELSIAKHEYTVTAVYRTWSRTSAVASATVTVGVATQFSIAASTTTPAAGAAVNLTITAQDEKGSKVTTYTGAHNLVFSGAAASPSGQQPNVAPSSSATGVNFGTATALNFTSGVSSVSSGKNGVLKLYKVGAAEVTASEGSITDPTPVEFVVAPAAAAKFTMTADKATIAAGEEVGLTITAFDTYGNVATGYANSHKITFSPASSVGTNVSSVADSSGTPVAIGTATSIDFTEGVAEPSKGANGVATLYKAGSQALKAAEGSITNATAATVTVNPGAMEGLKMTASSTSVAAAASVTLTMTAVDKWGNTVTSYAGDKNLVFSGAAASPSGQAATVTNKSSAAINFGQTTVTTFASGTKTATLKLYNAASASVTMTDGTYTTAPIAFTVTPTTAAKIAWVGLTQSAGSGAASCFITTCTITGVGNNGTVKGSLGITDTYGNVVSNYGASKIGTLSASTGTVTGGSMVFPETGPALTTTQFTYTYPASGSTTATLTAAATGRTSITGTVAK